MQPAWSIVYVSCCSCQVIGLNILAWGPHRPSAPDTTQQTRHHGPLALAAALFGTIDGTASIAVDLFHGIPPPFLG